MKTALIYFLIIFSAVAINAQTTSFTYQGKLNDGALPANGQYQLEFKLFDTPQVGTGTQVGGIVQTVTVNVVNGVFTTQLDFGQAPFASGSERFLEIAVRRNANEAYSTLEPRQPLTSTPYAIKAKNAEVAVTAANTQQLGGIDASQFVQTGDSRLTDARNPLPGSTSYVQNRTTQQASTNFNISGEGRATIITAGSQFNLGANRILSNAGVNNLFIGVGAGSVTTGGFNTFVGADAGRDNTSGEQNAFFGRAAGFSNTTGYGNSFIGRSAGLENTTGYQNTYVGQESGLSSTEGFFNSFVGALAGRSNTTGNSNSFFGAAAGLTNSTGFANSFFGLDAGRANTTADYNSFFGAAAGKATTTGNNNTVIGAFAGQINTTGTNNTLIGANADVASGGLVNATAVGAGSVVSTSNTIVLGRSNGADKVRVPGLGAAGSESLCRNANFEISSCSSSGRYKTNIADYGSGLRIVNLLRPVTFNWLGNGKADLGLVAEEVAEADENLIIRNEKGEVEGVKYDRVGVVLVNAVKEQQAIIERQQKQIDEQQKQIELLKRMICSQNAGAEGCK
ncbi:MAG: tail fiber domain-containing protein [Pyrinomonadaceae bacterium]|nr:tail fiber domain-containing protein [Pyrinomonadaceae bacterium]